MVTVDRIFARVAAIRPGSIPPHEIHFLSFGGRSMSQLGINLFIARFSGGSCPLRLGADDADLDEHDQQAI
jgi:hypothetical protein